MSEYKFTVRVTASTRKEAERVMSERILHDEDYGFPYAIHIDGTANDPATNGNTPELAPHAWEPSNDTHGMQTDPNCRICGEHKRSAVHY